MASPTRASGRRAIRAMATVAVLLVAGGCAEPYDEANEATEPTSESSAPADDESFCEVLDTLVLPEDAADLDLADAPDELVVSLQFLAELEPDRADLGDLASGLEAQATVDAWGHEHCGGPHPFCSLWVTVNGVVAEAVLAGDDRDAANADLAALLGPLDDDLVQHVPDDLVDAIKDHLVFVDAALGGVPPSDFDERDAEAAQDALDEWASSSCG